MNTAAEKIPATGPQRRSFLLCILFLLCALLWTPEIYYIWQLKFTYLPFFTTGALAFLALGIIVQGPEFQPLRKFMLIAGIAFCLMFLGQILNLQPM